MRRAKLLLLPLIFAACGPQGATPNRSPEFSRTDAVTQVCANGATVTGIDVSTWQGTIDWDAMATGGYAFAIARISDGTGYYDDQFDRNWGEIKRVGLVRGAYQFYEPGESATDQANLVVRVLGALGPGDLPVTLDVETGSPNAGDMRTWANIVQAGTGKTPMIYTAWGFWNGHISGGFEDLPLWVANWGVSCPGLPANWGGWSFWQYADNTSVPGISGSVDGDVFNGSAQDLAVFAGGSANTQPIGYLDVADCDQVAGWSQDPDVPSQAINVDVYFGGPAGSGVPGIRLLAGNDRADLCSAIGSCNHGYSVPTPRSLMDGVARDLHAYGIDSAGGNNPELGNSPRSLSCVPTESGVRRHVTDPTSYAAWSFDAFRDVRPLSDADFNAFTQGPDLGATPSLVQAAGDPAVYLVDGTFKRHVPSPDVMTNWRFDWNAIQPIDASVLAAMPQGPDVRARPQLIQGSGPEIDILDDALPVIPSTIGTTSSGSTTGAASTTTTTTTGESGIGTTTSTTGTSGSGATTTSTSTTASTGTSGTSGVGLGATTGGTTTGAAATGTTGGAKKTSVDGGCSSAPVGSAWMPALGALILLARRRR